MLPTLQGQECLLVDSALLPRRGDIAVYLEWDRLVAHRVVQTGTLSVSTRGDNQAHPIEVPRHAIVGVVTAIEDSTGVRAMGTRSSRLWGWCWAIAPTPTRIVGRMVRHLRNTSRHLVEANQVVHPPG